MKNRILLAVAVLFVIPLSVGLLLPKKQIKPGLSPENINRLYAGMPENRIVVLLGEPDARVGGIGENTQLLWNDLQTLVDIIIDGNGRLIQAHIRGAPDIVITALPERTWKQWLFDLLGL